MDSEKILVVDDEGSQSFTIETAEYNIKERKHGYEMTFLCHANENKEHDYSPWFEVTVVTKEKPDLSVGSQWIDQPGYIDQPNLYNVTNFYRYTHTCVEDFSVSIMEINDSSVKAKIIGKPEDGTIELSVIATFALNSDLKRGIE